MSTVEETSTQKDRRVVYIVITLALVILLIIALVFYRSAESDQQAQDKANQLIAALQKAGVRTVPSQEQIVRVLGNNGRALCKDPSSGLRRSILFDQLTNGASGPGRRPVIVDNRVFKGQLLVIQIYCPDKLPQFQQMVERLKTAPVAGGQ
jgi:Tfp pilus assembly protein FimT